MRRLHRSRSSSPKVRSSSKKKKKKHAAVDIKCPNRTTLYDYDVWAQIGQGAFSVVQVATVRGLRRVQNVIIKQYEKAKLSKEPTQVESLKKEIKIMSKLSHTGIMKFYDAIDSGGKISLVVEFIDGNNLY